MKETGSRTKRMAQKGSLKQMRIPSGSTTMRTTHVSRGASKEERRREDSKEAAAREKARAAKDPEEDASSRKGKAGLILPMIRQMLGKPKDNGRTVNGKINHGMTGPGTSPRKPMQQKDKERKESRAKEKASLARMERTGSPVPKMEQPSLQMLPRAVLQLPQRSTLTT